MMMPQAAVAVIVRRRSWWVPQPANETQDQWPRDL